MPTAPPTGSGAFARTTITAVMATTAVLAFTFSFGNVWALALRLGVSRPVAPLIAPMVDLSVAGLLIALHHLAATGTHPGLLRPATRLMHLCGLLTLALNTAEPVLAGQYGRACLDIVAPVLLLGWCSVGPGLLRDLHTPTTAGPTEPGPPNPRHTGHAGESEQTEETGDGYAATDHAQDTEPHLPVGDDNAMLTLVSAAGVLPDEWSDALDDSHPAQNDDPLVHPRDTPAEEQSGQVGEEPTGGRDKPLGRPPGAKMKQLREIGLQAATAEGKLTRTVVEQAIRDAGLPLASNRLTELMNDLRLRWDPKAGRPHPTAD
ncbi:DUF2637 domain-containing protein [Kitasatospora sp. P5_F3]